MLTRKVNQHLSDNGARKNVVIGDLRDEIRKLEKKESCSKQCSEVQ